MQKLCEKEMAIKMYYEEYKGYGTISKELNLSVNTIKSWIRRHRIANDIKSRTHTVRNALMNPTKKPSKTAVSLEKRIKQLEMEVDLLQNFLYEEERRSIKK